MPPLVLVAAVAENGVIGRDNGLIWRLKSDMKHFRAITLGKPVLMGRKTYESIGKPLPGRQTIVLSRSGFAAEGVKVARNLDQALSMAGYAMQFMGAGEVIVAGGADLYEQTMPLAGRLEMTEVRLSPEGDAHFPMIDRKIWREVEREENPAGPDDEAAFAFVTYQRR
jgi:dihydrofolate reductase